LCISHVTVCLSINSIKYVISLDRFKSHISEKHSDLQCYYKSLRDIFYQNHRAIYPDSSRRPVETIEDLIVIVRAVMQPIVDQTLPHIPVYIDGLFCMLMDSQGKPCRYSCRTTKAMPNHCLKEHGWVSPRQPGRPQNTRKERYTLP
jgi:hypothetical protein